MGRLSEALTKDFDGSTYNAARDHARLSNQLYLVSLVLSDHQWHTLTEIARRVNGSEAGVSARIRDLRKERFGNHTIDREHVNGGIWRYRMAS